MPRGHVSRGDLAELARTDCRGEEEFKIEIMTVKS